MIIFSLKDQFLDDGIDIPFYNGVPKLSTFDWIIMLASTLLMIGYCTVLILPKDYMPLICCLTGVIPALYICKGNYSIFFKKLTLKNIAMAIVVAILSFIYSMVIFGIIVAVMGPGVTEGASNASVTIMSVLSMVIQLLGEEFFKIFILILIMFVIYKFTNNRGIALFFGLIISMVIFGLSHYSTYDSRIIQIILIQGFGSIFEYYRYLKTKNIWVSYLIHLIYDCIPDLMQVMHVF